MSSPQRRVKGTSTNSPGSAFSASPTTNRSQDTHSLYFDTANDHIRLLWMAIGEDDRLITRYRTLATLLDQRGALYTSTIISVADEWDVWRKYLMEFAQLIFQPGA
ncbi:hypothetical protein ACFL5H_01480 [Candidatus Latescibacterota bacterium]